LLPISVIFARGGFWRSIIVDKSTKLEIFPVFLKQEHYDEF